WQEGLNEITRPKSTIRFLERKERYIRSAIEYFTPIIFVVLAYIYHELLCNYFNYSKEIDLISIQRVTIIFITLFSLGLLVSKYLSNWFGGKVDKFKHDNGLTISKG